MKNEHFNFELSQKIHTVLYSKVDLYIIIREEF